MVGPALSLSALVTRVGRARRFGGTALNTMLVRIENAMADLKKAIESNDAAAMSKSMDALMQAQHKASEALYKDQQASAEGSTGSTGSTGSNGSTGSGSTEGGAKPEGDVIDAEVVEDEKK